MKWENKEIFKRIQIFFMQRQFKRDRQHDFEGFLFDSFMFHTFFRGNFRTKN